MNQDDLRDIINESIPKLDEFEEGFYEDAEELLGIDKANTLFIARDIAYIKGVIDCLTDNNASIATNLMAAIIRIQTFKNKEDE